jgi:hypothetical protein
MAEESLRAAGLAGFQAVSEHHPQRRNLLASLLEALHRSRQLQTCRILRQYDHLIAKPDRPVASDTPNLEGH